MKTNINARFAFLATFLFLASCATYQPQSTSTAIHPPTDKEIAHSFYLIGDAGNAAPGNSTPAIEAFQKALAQAPKNSTALFLGDNIYPDGLPTKNDAERSLAEHRLQVQIDAVKEFKGETIFIPGNHDWYNEGTYGLKRQEKFVEDALGKNTFLPEDGCPIEKVNISDDIVLILVDTEWYITNWDKHPNINDDCEIKTRNKFLDEYESQIKKARGKTTIVALHHPMYTNGPHGGQYSAKQVLKPLPVLGALIRKAGGVSPSDMQHPLYNELRKRIITLSQENDKVVFVSGHEHSLQYIVNDNLPQIVSGSGSKISATKNVNGGQFSYGAPGYARLDVFADGSSHVQFFTVEEGDNLAFSTQVFEPNKEVVVANYEESFPATKKASIYTEAETDKGNFYRSLWGDRYRKYYSTPVEAPTVNLDTLFGGLKPVRKGGGHQSVSLRLEDKEGREYVMRALRKNAVQYLQAVAFKDQYIEGQFNDTFTQALLLDIFTGAHPYAPFTIGKLSDAVDVFHTNPVLYYVPKQNALGAFNEEFGDALYMIEERAASGHGDKKSFGYSDKLISTDDMLKKIHKDEDIVVDEASYIRARLFDMVIGDWDRHEDQWRWAEFKEDGKKVYRPVPRDRDQAFSIMSDGALLGTATKLIPGLKLLRSYDDELKNPKWFNTEPYPLDVALIAQSDKSVWDQQVQTIKQNLTDAVIDEALAIMPAEVTDGTIDEIKRKLRGRRDNLHNISEAYFGTINKFSVVTGTNKDDWFVIERMPQGKTKITGYRIKKGQKADVFHSRIYSCEHTKEIWLYGLDDDDRFEVTGYGDKLIMLRIVGGLNNDTYAVTNQRKVKIYDHRSKKNTFESNKGHIKLSDDYDTNVYDYKKLKNNTAQVLPALGFNPDIGLSVGASAVFTNYGFERNPFSSQHKVSGNFYGATSGFDLTYSGEWANVVGHWNLGLMGTYTGPNFATNFFGFGNETENLETEGVINPATGEETEFDFNRVNMEGFKLMPSLIWRGRAGGSFQFGISYEQQEVEQDAERITGIPGILPDRVFDAQQFWGAEASYGYANADNDAFPTLGLKAELTAGWKSNADESTSFGYVIPSLSIDHRLTANGRWVLATKVKGHINLGDDFEFYQAATIGGVDGLRGFRNQRFTGKTSFYQNTDLRLHLRKLKTGILPLSLGLYGGFDYGRVWVDNDDSNRWNTSYGGGLWLNGADMLGLQLAMFQSDDSSRFVFGLGFSF